jgi:hypothetical protein
LRAGSGLHGDGVHTGDFEETIFEQLYDFQAALRKFLGLIGMLSGDAVEAGDKLVYARIVLHGAGTERIHPQIDGVIPGGKTREVAQNFDLTNFRKPGNALVAMMTAQDPRVVGGWDVQRGQFEGAFSGRGDLKDKAFVLINVLGRFFDQFGIPIA